MTLAGSAVTRRAVLLGTAVTLPRRRSRPRRPPTRPPTSTTMNRHDSTAHASRRPSRFRSRLDLGALGSAERAPRRALGVAVQETATMQDVLTNREAGTDLLLTSDEREVGVEQVVRLFSVALGAEAYDVYEELRETVARDRKSTRLNSSH